MARNQVTSANVFNKGMNTGLAVSSCKRITS